MTSVSSAVLASFSVVSSPGNERDVQQRVAAAVAGCGLSADQLERLKTAVAEAAMNAIEHGNQNRPDLPVEVRVVKTADEVVVTITDRGDRPVDLDGPAPDLEKKLRGEQSPRGWGLFLIRHMVDDFEVAVDDDGHHVRLSMRLGQEGADDGSHV